MRPNLISAATKIFSVEWNQNVASVQNQLFPAATHFVFPDLPEVFTDEDRDQFSGSTDTNQQIYTIATSQHENADSLLKKVSNVDPGAVLLLVSGNSRGPETMSSIEAAKILQNEKGNILWGVANPNDPKSIDAFEKKLQSGMKGFISQPLLSTHALETIQTYRSIATTDETILAGLAFPKTIRGLQFWAKLLEQEEQLEKDPLFQSHLEFFSQPNATPVAWIEREMQDLLLMNNANDTGVDGIHFMPLKNTDDLCKIFQSLNHLHRSS
jgi:5,10-methylenetetrahydrofolate reductase